MTDQSVFETTESKAPVSGDPVVAEAQAAQPTTAYEDLLAEIKNESGERKYDSIPKALEGLRNAQDYIPQLKGDLSKQEQEIIRLREELAKRESVEDVVSRLTSERAKDGTPATEGLDEQKINDIVQSIIQRNSAESQQASNAQVVSSALIAKYGDAEKAKAATAAKAEELGISVKELGELAKKSPKAVLAYFSVAPQGQTKTNSGTVNTSPFQRGQEEVKLERPEKSLLAGATSKEQAAYMAAIKAKVYADLGVEQ